MEEYKLSDIAEVQTGPFGSQLHNEDYVTIGTPIVTVEHLGNRQFSKQNLPLVSDADKERLAKYILQEGDIVFSRVGSVDRCSYVSASENGWLFSGRCLRVRCGDSCYPLFLYYYFCNEPIKQYIKSIAVGATMPSINTKLMADIPIVLPNIENQKHIAAILSSIDDKIELNRRINGNLEQQAQALFKAWFVDFEPFKNGKFVDSELGKIPEDWRVGTIEELCQHIASGSTPSSMNKEYYNGNIKWFTTKELNDTFLLDSEKHISEKGHQSSSTKMFPTGTVLMAIYAAPTVGRLGILTSNATFNQAAVGLTPKQEIGSYYIFLLLKNERNNFNNLAIGAAQQNLSVKFVKTYITIIPSEKVIYDFNIVINPLFDKVKFLNKQISSLTNLRDTLLPKLMSGELKIE